MTSYYVLNGQQSLYWAPSLGKSEGNAPQSGTHRAKKLWKKLGRTSMTHRPV